MRFVTLSEAADRIRGKSVAVVGSAPSVLENEPGFVDAHDVVVRVNNYKTSAAAGHRCDVHYAFYGTSIRKSAEELKSDGVMLCMCKCPDAKPIECEWHERNGKQVGIDFRYIYQLRKDWWFCDTFIPTVDHFRQSFEMLGKHIPSTGFSAILDIISCGPASIFVTGFDFFTSGKHNVDESWRSGDPFDPIGHRPGLEKAWLSKNARLYPMKFDRTLAKLLATA